MKDKQKLYFTLNNVVGWLVGITACVVYVMTAERTTSWWDCGEYISTAFKLQIGHPPGAPTFQLIGRLFSLFSGGDIMLVGFLINCMSAISSGLTILFLFWSISMLAKKVACKNGKMSVYSIIVILGSALVGSLAYTFTDSFWFSAVEGEVYAMSSFFTAITFWAILKWETQADQPHHLRWLIFISLLIGLSIGVHLLNLLAIPAVVFVVYYKKFTSSRKGFWVSALISFLLIAIVLWGIIPNIVSLSGKFDLFFVNSLGLPFNSGTYFYFAIIIGLIVFLLWYSIRKNKAVLNTIVLCFVFLLIGYSTFFTLVIRANAAPPINENEPKNAYSLLSYLNRDQYGQRPLLYGQYFTAQYTNSEEASPIYARNDETEKYEKVGSNVKLIWDRGSNKNQGLFPRMHSSDESRGHITYYKIWSRTPC
ncbi:hypothetical protein FACS1894178_9300 [Bacteroidia bacterium]|nr:hypothetical protein FACS1894178_9300 [Bacteroidia bacterium]